ncbi:sensor histidine kinase [Streptomyces sp. NPDC004629]|uniref:sensor histidine kinase n=1 Tax=Streptomyces sp. NPDC004629 TaxID=3364705 RepID=UPI0036AE0F29
MLRLMESLARWRGRHPRLMDVLLVVLVAAPPVIRDQPGWRPVWVQTAVYAALVLPLLWRRRHPVAVAACVTAAFWAQHLGEVWGREPGRGALALAAVFYTLSVRGLRRAAAVTAACAGACVLLWAPGWVADYPRLRTGGIAWLTPVSVVLWLAGAWVLGAYVRARRAYLAEFARRVELAESRRLALARAAVAEERTRIAREIHDVLAHGVTVMVLNAEGARLARDTDPGAPDRALRTIGTTGRAALCELRRLLDVLRADEPPANAPQAGELHHFYGELSGGGATLDELRALVDRLPGSRLELSGERDGVSAALAEQTYRIVQEALTNVAKHASPGAVARVRVDLGTPGPERRVRIRVDNSAGTGSAPPALPASAGRGLVGMRERAALYGGTVEAGPLPEGGYRVDAALGLTPRRLAAVPR